MASNVKTLVVGFRLTPSTLAQLKEHAAKDDRSVAYLGARIVEEWLDQADAEPATTAPIGKRTAARKAAIKAKAADDLGLAAEYRPPPYLKDAVLEIVEMAIAAHGADQVQSDGVMRRVVAKRWARKMFYESRPRSSQDTSMSAFKHGLHKLVTDDVINEDDGDQLWLTGKPAIRGRQKRQPPITPSEQPPT